MNARYSHGGDEHIVLHRDAVSGDMDLIGQLQHHTPPKFVSLDMEAAHSARRDRQALSENVREALDLSGGRAAAGNSL